MGQLQSMYIITMKLSVYAGYTLVTSLWSHYVSDHIEYNETTLKQTEIEVSSTIASILAPYSSANKIHFRRFSAVSFVRSLMTFIPDPKAALAANTLKTQLP